MMATGINAGESNTGSGTARDRLKTFITRWQGIRDAISDLNDRIERSRTGESLDKLEPLERRLRELQESRRDIVDNIQGIVGNKPGLYDEAVKWGFRSDLLPGGGDADSPSGVNAGEQKAGGGGEGGTTGGGGGGKTSGSTGGGGGGKGGGGGGTGLGSRERLKNFKLVRLPSGRVMAVRTINVRGNKVQWGVWVDKADFDKYGVNEKKISSITKAQARKIEAMGNADELVFRGDDKNEFKAIVRGITRAHKGSPILDNDEVLGIIVAQSALGLTDSETQGLLKQTRWYKRSTDHEQVWTLDYSPEKRREDIKNMRIRLVDELEDLYGLDWQKHVDGGMKKVRTWAQRIASGELGGDPSAGLDRWMRNQFDKAAEIEGTPAWMQRQSEAEEVAKWHNRPEEMFERLRSETLAYLGYDKNNTPRIDRGSLKQWAGQLVSGEKSEGDWAQFLRNQMKTLFPYFDPNIAFTDQASAYKSIAERTLGDTLDWNDRLLRDFSRLNNNGEPTGNAMSLHDFEMKVRADKRARREGSGIWQEGEQFAQGLAQVFKGVT